MGNKAVTIFSNVNYIFKAKEGEGSYIFVDFWDHERTERLCHLRVREEQSELVLNSFVGNSWKKEKIITYFHSQKSHITVRFEASRVYITASDHSNFLELNYPYIAERVGYINYNGFESPANLLQEEIFGPNLLNQTMSSIEYSILNARLRILESELAQIRDRNTNHNS